MKSIALSIAILAALSLSPNSQAHDGQDHAASNKIPSATSINTKQAATRAVLRDMWVEHVFWIRSYVIASESGNETQKKVAADQVVANAKMISGAIAGFYGQPAGDRMLTLLAGHWGAVKDYSDASLISKDARKQQDAVNKLMANAKEISVFLSKANPNLPEATLFGLLSGHGAHHIAQIQQISKNDYATEAKTWDAMRTHMFTIADALADALAKQFPAKF